MAWSLSDLQRLKDKGLRVDKTFSDEPKIKIPKKEAAGLAFIKSYLKLAEIQYETEVRFDTVRKFRFDVAIPQKKIAIEYEGLMSAKSGHTTVSGYVSDCEKYNLAQINGWIVLRYTAVNFRQFPNDLKKLIE